MDGIDAVTRRLEIESVEAWFQPVFNVRTGSVMGTEALLRPRTKGGDHIPPTVLLQGAMEEGSLRDLDQAARVASLQAFSAELPSPEIILFLNISPSLIDSGEVNGTLLLSTVRHYGLAVRNVAVELPASEVHDLDSLVHFSRSLRQGGFLICVDNFGTERSSLERIAALRPDIVKIDRSVIHNVAEGARQRGVLKSIVYVTREMGALCLAHGVERYDDLEVCRLENVDLAQGFLLGRPDPVVRPETVRRSSSHFNMLRRSLPDYLRRRRDRFRVIHEKTDVIVESLSRISTDLMTTELERIILDLDIFDAGYILDRDGIQVSRTIMTRPRKRRERHPVFHPTPVGTDHRLMDYAYGLGALDHDRYTSQPYLSLNSGELCRTISRHFVSADGRELVVCVDIPVEADQ